MGSEAPPTVFYITGFKKFQGVPSNPTEALVRALPLYLEHFAELPPHARLAKCTVLETVAKGGVKVLLSLLDSPYPTADDADSAGISPRGAPANLAQAGLAPRARQPSGLLGQVGQPGQLGGQAGQFGQSAGHAAGQAGQPGGQAGQPAGQPLAGGGEREEDREREAALHLKLSSNLSLNLNLNPNASASANAGSHPARSPRAAALTLKERVEAAAVPGYRATGGRREGPESRPRGGGSARAAPQVFAPPARVKLFPHARPGERVVWVHLGVNSGAARFAIERRAVNEATFRCPDEWGWQPQKEMIAADDCSLTHIRETTLPAEYIVATLKARGLDVALSDDAGRFVCNYVYYQSLRHAQEVTGATCLFVHVPTFHVIDQATQLKFLSSLLQVVANC
eukprot:jgi/Mesen1/3828/ME000207S02838